MAFSVSPPIFSRSSQQNFRLVVVVVVVVVVWVVPFLSFVRQSSLPFVPLVGSLPFVPLTRELLPFVPLWVGELLPFVAPWVQGIAREIGQLEPGRISSISELMWPRKELQVAI